MRRFGKPTQIILGKGYERYKEKWAADMDNVTIMVDTFGDLQEEKIIEER